MKKLIMALLILSLSIPQNVKAADIQLTDGLGDMAMGYVLGEAFDVFVQHTQHRKIDNYERLLMGLAGGVLMQGMYFLQLKEGEPAYYNLEHFGYGVAGGVVNCAIHLKF